MRLSVKLTNFALVYIAFAGTGTLRLHPACSQCLKGKFSSQRLACVLSDASMVTPSRESSVRRDAVALNKLLLAFLRVEGVTTA